ncbi:MAG: GntR family transcriptional regulator [Kiritimatiellia bacterium]
MKSRQSTASKKSGRPAVLSPAVAARIREAIVSGHWQPGDRLPTRRELCVSFDCSTITLQMAMNMLASERFICSNGRRGTFVAERPPHLTEVAVVFPAPPVESNHFWVAIDNTIKHATFGDVVLSSWYGVERREDNPVYCALCERVRQGSLAGLLFVTSPFGFLKSPLLLERPDIPRVAFASDWQHAGVQLSTIGFNHVSFAERAVERLARQNCRRVAVVTYPDDGHEAWRAIARRHGLELRPYWYQGVSQISPGTGRNLARLLFRDGQVDRPDAVIVADDNLLEPIALGIRDAKMRVPRDVVVVSHCNFPWPTRSVVPVIRLGWDTRGILELALDMLKHVRGRSLAKKTSVDAVFEEELSTIDQPR